MDLAERLRLRVSGVFFRNYVFYEDFHWIMYFACCSIFCSCLRPPQINNFISSIVISSTANTTEHQVQGGLLWRTLTYITVKMGMHNCQEPHQFTFLLSYDWPCNQALCSTSRETPWNSVSIKMTIALLCSYSRGLHVYAQTRMHACSSSKSVMCVFTVRMREVEHILLECF